MSMQLIFLLETDKKCNSDWIYIKETIDKFFNYKSGEVKLTPEYLNGKGNYKNKKQKIKTLESQYKATSKNNISKVLLCLDCDDYDKNPNDEKFINEARLYCEKNGFELVWFCKDIERVYIGKKVVDSEKKEEATNFKKNKFIEKVNKKKLTASQFKNNSSNIVSVLGKYLDEK